MWTRSTIAGMPRMHRTRRRRGPKRTWIWWPDGWRAAVAPNRPARALKQPETMTAPISPADLTLPSHIKLIRTRHGPLFVLATDDTVCRSLIQFGEWT